MRKKRVLSEEHKRKIGLSHLGRKKIFSAEALENMRIAALKRRGKCFHGAMGEEQKRRIREANSKPKSEEHKRKIAETLRGRKNPEHSARMKGRPSPLKGRKLSDSHVAKIRGQRRSEKKKSYKHQEWAKKIKERDQWKCTKCSSIKNLAAHHIIPWKEREDLRFDMDNGITLCQSCHAKLEGFQVGHPCMRKKKLTVVGNFTVV